MNPGLLLPVDAIRDHLNGDKEFLLTARFWTCDLRFVLGEDVYFMHIDNGRVASFQHGTHGFDPYAITIGGPVEIWEKMLVEKPKPFYHDWFAAAFHHDFEFGGDLEAAYAYYYAIRRIKIVMGECVRELDRAA
jgi:hypothetical protein